MSCNEWTKSIKGVDDVELGLPRFSPLIYHCTAPQSARADGLVFVIPDFGDEANGEQLRSFRTYLAETHNLLAVTVEYHCYQSRLPTGAQFFLTPEDLAELDKLGAKYSIFRSDPVELISELGMLSDRNELDVHVAPSNGDYQNLGVMQALDHLAVLADLLSAQPGSFDQENVLAIGASHGAYIGHMISKLAPNTLRAVIDNASYTDAAPALVRVAPVFFGNLQLNCTLVHKWNFDAEDSAGYFLRGRRRIRHTALQLDIEEMARASQRTCQYRMIHALQDDMQLIEEKRVQARLLGDAGFDVVLKEASEQESGQGLDSSLRAMFDYFYPSLAARLGKLDWELGTDIGYFCDDYYYSFLHGASGCVMRVAPIPTGVAGAAVLRPKFYGEYKYGNQNIQFHIGVPGY